jgi:type IV fimbrial biogenesis protein FimT
MDKVREGGAMTFFAVHSNRGSVARSRFPQMQGFTLIELMITVVVLAILLALAAPSMGNLVRDQRVKTAVGDVYVALAFARSEAIKRNVTVGVCSHNGSSGCQNSADWATYGWIVYLDVDGNGYPGAVSDILKKQDPLPNLTLTSTAAKIGYQGDGRLVLNMGGDSATGLTFAASIAGNTSVTARCVRLDLSGRPNIKVDTNSNPADGCN